MLDGFYVNDGSGRTQEEIFEDSLDDLTIIW